MATALKLRTDIAKLKKGLAVKGLNKSLKDKLEAQLKKAEDELDKVRQSGKPSKKYSGKATQSALTKLQQFIDKPKYSVYKGKGVDLKKDAGEGAFKVGKRTSKGLKANQYGSKADNKGNTYYEYRVNRYDVKQPTKRQTYPKLADGGEMAKGGDVKKIIDSRGNTLYLTYDDPTHFFLSVDADRKGNPYHIGQINNEPYYNEVKEWLNSQKMADGGSIPEGYHQMPDGTIMPDSAHMASGGVVSAFEQKIKDAFKEKNKWQFINDNFDGKNVQLKMFVGAKEVDVQRYMIDGLHASMPKNYVGQRETMKMILDAFNRKEGGGEMAKGGLIQHGLEYGDEIISSSGGNVIEVKSKSGDRFLVNLDKGKRLNKKEYTMDSAKTTYKDFFMADGGMMARGGHVSKGELVWRKLSNADRTNFLKENFSPEITPMSQHLLVGKDFNFLPKKVKIKLEAKYANVEDYADGGMMSEGGFFDKKEDVVFKFQEGEKIKVLQYSGGKLKPLEATIYKQYAAEQPDGTYYPFYLTIGSWEDFEEGKKHPSLYAEDELIERHKNKPKMADGGMMADGGEVKKEDVEIIGVPRNKITEKEWKSILRMAKYQDGATYILKDEKGLDVVPQVQYEWYLKEKMADGGETEKMALGGATVSTQYEKVEGTDYELKIKVYYDKGGISYATYKQEPRGYYLSVSPVQREKRDGYTVESYMAFSGVKTLLLPVQRQSPKAEKQAQEIAEKMMPEMKSYISEKVKEKAGFMKGGGYMAEGGMIKVEEDAYGKSAYIPYKGETFLLEWNTERPTKDSTVISDRSFRRLDEDSSLYQHLLVTLLKAMHENKVQYAEEGAKLAKGGYMAEGGVMSTTHRLSK